MSTMSTMSTIEHSTLLAQTLATENINVVRARTSTASFDLQTRTLTIPIWDNMDQDIERMLIEHEVGHALFTPMAYFETVQARKYLSNAMNVLEDVRIERKFKEKYPGSRNDFTIAARKLRETDFFEIADRDVTKMNLLDRMNLFFKLGSASGVTFARDEAELVGRARTVDTFEDMVALAEDVISFIESERDAKEELEPESDGGNRQSSSGAGSSEDPAEGEAGGEADEGEEEEFDSNKASGEADESEEEEFDSNQASGEIESETVKLAEQKFSEMAGTAGEVSVVDISANRRVKTMIEKCFVSYKEILAKVEEVHVKLFPGHSERFLAHSAPYERLRARVIKQVNHLVAQFEMRQAAKVYALRETRRTGVLDVNKIANYRTRDDIFLAKTIVPEGKNHGLVMLLDWSGSMSKNQNHITSMQQVIQLVMFCRRVNIPYRVFAFSEDRRFEMLELFSNEQTKTEQTQMFIYACCEALRFAYPMCQTPLAPALVYMQDYLPRFKQQYKVDKLNLITFTDGANTVPLVAESYSPDTRYVQDPVTKKRYRVSEPSMRKTSQRRIAECNAYYSILKDRYDCTITSFFIHDVNLTKTVYYAGCHDSGVAASIAAGLESEFKKKGFVSYKGYGRDNIFLVKSSSLVTKDFSAKGVTSSMTAATVAKTLTQSARHSTKGKILIEKFVEAIA